MPGTPGPRLTGGPPHASDSVRHVGVATPYERDTSLPMTRETVGAITYGPDRIQLLEEATR